jgi:hypothetical protein
MPPTLMGLVLAAPAVPPIVTPEAKLAVKTAADVAIPHHDLRIFPPIHTHDADSARWPQAVISTIAQQLQPGATGSRQCRSTGPAGNYSVRS